MSDKRSTEDNLYILGCFFLVGCIVAGVLFMKVLLPHISLPPCVLYDNFGLYCPGCGGTRAVISLLHGHLLQSLWYHPLVPYAAVLYSTFMLTQTVARLTHYRYFHGMKFHNWYLYATIVIVAVNWILKNALLLCLGISI